MVSASFSCFIWLVKGYSYYKINAVILCTWLASYNDYSHIDISTRSVMNPVWSPEVYAVDSRVRHNPGYL